MQFSLSWLGSCWNAVVISFQWQATPLSAHLSNFHLSMHSKFSNACWMMMCDMKIQIKSIVSQQKPRSSQLTAMVFAFVHSAKKFDKKMSLDQSIKCTHREIEQTLFSVFHWMNFTFLCRKFVCDVPALTSMFLFELSLYVSDLHETKLLKKQTQQSCMLLWQLQLSLSVAFLIRMSNFVLCIFLWMVKCRWSLGLRGSPLQHFCHCLVA